MIVALFAAAALLAGSTPTLQAAAATTEAAAAAAPPAPVAAKPTKTAAAPGLVCRREADLGTRLPKKKCRSAAQMADQQREDRAQLENAQRNMVLEQVR